jgi:hypothetical protein
VARLYPGVAGAGGRGHRAQRPSHLRAVEALRLLLYQLIKSVIDTQGRAQTGTRGLPMGASVRIIPLGFREDLF